MERHGTWVSHASPGEAVPLFMALIKNKWKRERDHGWPRDSAITAFLWGEGTGCAPSLYPGTHLRSHLPVHKLASCNCGFTEARSFLCSFPPSINIYLSHAKGSSINRGLCLPRERQLHTPSCHGTFLGRSLTSPSNWALLVGQVEDHLACNSLGKRGVR